MSATPSQRFDRFDGPSRRLWGQRRDGLVIRAAAEKPPGPATLAPVKTWAWRSSPGPNGPTTAANGNDASAGSLRSSLRTSEPGAAVDRGEQEYFARRRCSGSWPVIQPCWPPVRWIGRSADDLYVDLQLEVPLDLDRAEGVVAPRADDLVDDVGVGGGRAVVWGALERSPSSEAAAKIGLLPLRRDRGGTGRGKSRNRAARACRPRPSR